MIMTMPPIGENLVQIIASLDMFTGTHIYVDAMVFYTLLRAELSIRPIVARFFSRIESGEIIAHTPF